MKIRIRYTQTFQHLLFQCFHLQCLGIGLVIVSAQMQNAMYDHVGPVVFFLFALFTRFALDNLRVTDEEIVTGITAPPPSPTAFVLHGGRPNPFNPRTEIRFELSRAGPVSLRIFDLQGNSVRGLLAASMPAGEHVASWDGRGDLGNELPSGVYLVALETPEGSVGKKISLAK